MLTNYLKSAFRSLLRRKGYSFINIAGLTIGLACCMLIVQYVVFQTSFDAFNENAGSLYRIVTTEMTDGESSAVALSGYAAAPAFAGDAPEIERYARIHPEFASAVVTYDASGQERTFKEQNVLYVDSTFLDMFTYPLVRGNASRVLREPRTLLITESAAERYFGGDDPMGKTLDYTGWVEGSYTVAGVLADLPPTSHLQFDFLLPMRDLLASEEYRTEGSAWSWTNFTSYVQTHDGTDPSLVGSKLTETLSRHRGELFEARGVTASVELQPLRDVHLDIATESVAGHTTDPKTVYFFSVVALVTLVIALINYVNLATARAMDRAREVGVRKVVGAHRRQLMGQFLLESVLTNLAALILALGIAVAGTPYVNQVAGTVLGTSTWVNPWFAGIFVTVFLVGVLLSGMYPAFVLSSFRPASVLKGTATVFGGRAGLRKGLVVFQFAASIVLLIGTLVVVSQVRYMRNHDVGLALDQVLVVNGPQVLDEGRNRPSVMQSFADEVGSLASVSDYAFSANVPGRGFNWYSQVRQATADPSTAVDARSTWIDHRFLDLYGLELTAGQSFTENMAPPSDGQPGQVLINQSVVRSLGIESDADAVGRLLALADVEFEVRGVLRDFNWSSLHQPTEAVLLQYRPTSSAISFKVQSTNLPTTIAEIRRQYETMFPGNPFEYSFADAVFDEQYRSDERFARLFGLFAGLAISIACLGLFGLAAFTAEARTKEIGVRKVLGASVGSIVALLTKDFLRLVAVALILATPVAWYVMNGWLSDFAYRIELRPTVFLSAGALTMLIALLTVSYKSVRAALRDPVRSLRYD